MKTTLLTLVLISGMSALASTQNPKTAQEFKFVFKAPNAQSFEIKQKASDKQAAFKLAAKQCFQKLTGGHYPGEERGLDIIDICANPKM